jgi:hypothetical protein
MTATNKHIPGKRIKTWHRKHKKANGTLSLRAFAHSLVESHDADSRETASRWLGGKGVP